MNKKRLIVQICIAAAPGLIAGILQILVQIKKLSITNFLPTIAIACITIWLIIDSHFLISGGYFVQKLDEAERRKSGYFWKVRMLARISYFISLVALTTGIIELFV